MKHSSCGRVSRRRFLGDTGLGFTGLVLGTMLAEQKVRDGRARPASARAPKVENVIWLFMMGGVSHVEGFDPKPALNRYGGMRLGDTAARSVLESARLGEQEFGPEINYQTEILPLQTGFRKNGASR